MVVAGQQSADDSKGSGGRQVKCAAGGGGDGDRIGGEWVGCAFGKLRPEFIKSGLAECGGLRHSAECRQEK